MPMTVVEFTQSSPRGFVAPSGVSHVVLIGWGGGGGGGRGAPGGHSERLLSAGGAGGGGARKDVAVVPVEVGESYDVLVGAGGAGGVEGRSAQPGADTSFARSRDGVALARFRGAGGGDGAPTPTEWRDDGHLYASWGGLPIAGVRGWSLSALRFEDQERPLPPAAFGAGAFGFGLPSLMQGGGEAAWSVQGFAGGKYGPNGTSGPAEYVYGGAGGGGGAAGPGGAGADGGGGGHAASWDDRGYGGDGWAADDNSGAGGGGGGAGGGWDHASFQKLVSPSTVSHPGNGGDAGSGRLTLLYVT